MTDSGLGTFAPVESETRLLDLAVHRNLARVPAGRIPEVIRRVGEAIRLLLGEGREPGGEYWIDCCRVVGRRCLCECLRQGETVECRVFQPLIDVDEVAPATEEGSARDRRPGTSALLRPSPRRAKPPARAKPAAARSGARRP